jgi:hypothetical protein
MRSSSVLNSRRNNNPGASRFRAESRLGLPRPSLDSMRTTNRGNHPQSEAETDYDSYYDDDEDELEAQAEALLSRKHGEAFEAGETKKTNSSTNHQKRGAASATDQDIADEYAEQEKERKKKSKRKVHRTITPDDLIKPKGLTVVRNGIAPRFHSNVHVRGSNSNSNSKAAKYTNTTKSMAKYSRRLVSGYADWMESMTGGLSLHETQWKLRSMGSKTQIKQYLTDMRKTVRNDHVERLLGLEKAERLLGQLEDYYHDEEQYLGDEDDNHENNYHRETETEAMEGAAEESTNKTSFVSSPAIVNPYANNNNNSDARSSASRAPSVTVTPTHTANDAAKQHTNDDPTTGDNSDVEQRQQREDPLQRRLSLQKEQRAAQRHVLEDSDDEEEAIFDDVVLSTTRNANANAKKEDSSSPALPARTKAARRHVLDDDSDDDDSDDDDNNDAGKELEVGNADGVPGDDSIESSDEIQDGANITEDVDQDGNSHDADEMFTADSEVAITPTTTSSGGIEKLDEKFQNVKALLEGGGQTNNNALPKSHFEETEETADAAPMEEEPDDDKDDRIGDYAPAPAPMNNDEKAHQQESSLINDDEDKSEDNESSSEDQPLAKNSTTETGFTLSGTMEKEDDQAAVFADGH